MSIVSTRLMGGLGNYLFQIANAYAYSKRTNKDLILNMNDIHVVHKGIDTYKNNLFSKLKFDNLSQNIFNYKYSEPSFNYTEIPVFQGNIHLNGYFQSEKYFKDYKDEILDLFYFDDLTKNLIKQKYSNLLNNDTCSIHIRRGDYLNFPDIHPTQPIEYYRNSILKFDSNTNFLIFSDDIEWCKNNLSNVFGNFTFIEGNTDYQDLYLMSLCNNNIICNSTFSWWGAWLNNNSSKKVIVPSMWFGPKLNNYNTDDVYCVNWEKN